jgi:hypothetical protein
MVLASLSRLVLVVVLVLMDDGARELPAPLVPDLHVPLLVVSALLASLSRLVVLLVRMDDVARELPALLVPGLLVPLLVVSALLDALESLASLASIWDLEYMAVRDLRTSLSDQVCLNLPENFLRDECTEGESVMQNYQESSWKEMILEQLSRHFMCREVNKERLRHDTHLEIFTKNSLKSTVAT